MKRGLAWLLQAVVGLIGLVMLALLLWEPHLEGRNAHATTFQIYFQDPFLAYVYVGSIPFFVAMQRAFGLFGDVRRTGAFSAATLTTLRTIKRCGFVLLAFIGGGLGLILLLGDGEDRPAGVFMSFLAASGAGSIVAAAALFRRRVEKSLGLSRSG